MGTPRKMTRSRQRYLRYLDVSDCFDSFKAFLEYDSKRAKKRTAGNVGSKILSEGEHINMHDPSTVAFEIKYPFPEEVNKKIGYVYRRSIITIWHEDPCTDGTDDSCGWFLQSRHLNQEVLKKIISSFNFSWDRTFECSNGKTISTCWFNPDGSPHFSTIGIVVDMFTTASTKALGRRRAQKYMRDHLPEIINFAENPIDSLYNGIHRIFQIACDEPYTPEQREERIKDMAKCVYAYIMRDVRPWYKHPRWHIHHWRIQVHPYDGLKRFLTKRCCICGKRLRSRDCVYSNGDNKLWHCNCEKTEKAVVDRVSNENV